jgi:hypothetical protein
LGKKQKGKKRIHAKEDSSAILPEKENGRIGLLADPPVLVRLLI